MLSKVASGSNNNPDHHCLLLGVWGLVLWGMEV